MKSINNIAHVTIKYLNANKDLLPIIAAAIAGGMIIGYGLWGGKQEDKNQFNEIIIDNIIDNMKEHNTALMDKINENSKALGELSLGVNNLRKELEQNISRQSDADELNKNAVADLNREIRYLKKKIRRPIKNKKTVAKPLKTAQELQADKKAIADSPSASIAEKMHYLEFDYGSITIGKDNTKKLDTLISVLHDHPDLNLEITGYIDIERDKEALKQYRFNGKLKFQKLNDMVKNGLSPVPVEDVVIDKNEYEKYLKRAYNAETFPKPRNILGLPKNLPTHEMEKLIHSHINITNEDLRSFASLRALTVSDYILNSNNINLARISLNTPPSLSPDTKENVKDSLVIVEVRAPSPD